MDNFEDRLKDAIVCNDVHFLEKYIDQHNIDYCFLDEDNDSLLSYAISYKDSEAYTFFLNNGANIYLVNNEGESIIHSIVYSGLPGRLIEVLQQEPDALKLINSQTKDGTTPILLSVLLEKNEIFDLLIELGVDVNLVDETGNAPIHPACFSGYSNLVYKLVEKGANLHLKTKNGNYPLALAVNGEHDEIVKYLYSKIYM